MAKAAKLTNVVRQDAKRIYQEYSVKRAYPMLADGMHIVNRSILYALMHKFKDEDSVASPTLSSFVAYNYHLHKPEGIYRTALMMSGERLPLVSSTRKDDAYALREGIPTEKYVTFSKTYWGNYVHESIINSKMINNYTLTQKMPNYYPTMLPYLLFTNYTNINVGVTNNTVSMNPNEIFQMMLYLLEDATIPVAELIKCYKGPDIGKNYTIVGHPQSLHTLIETGYGKFDIITNVEFTRDTIIFKDVPYRSTKNKFLRYLSEVKFETMITEQPEKVSSPNRIMQLRYKLRDGFTLKDAQQELYKKTTLKKTIAVELVGFHAIDKDCPNAGKLDIVGIKEYLLNCLHYGYNNRVKDIELQIEDCYKQVEYNALLEKLTRPEVLTWFQPTLELKNKREILYTKGNAEIKDAQIGQYVIVKGGMSKADVETTFQKHKNDILGRLDERNTILQELQDLDRKLIELHDALAPMNVITYIKEVIEEWMRRPECVRQSEVLFTTVDDAITTKCELSEQMLIKHMVATSENVDMPVNVVFYKDGSADYWNPEKGDDVPTDMMSKDINTILRCTTNDTILVFNSERRFKVKVKYLINTLSEFNKLTQLQGMEFYGAIPYEWNVDKPADDDLMIIVTSRGRVKKAAVSSILQKFEIVKPMPMYTGEYIKHVCFMPQSEMDDYTLEVVTKRGIKRKRLKEAIVKSLKGYVSLISYDLLDGITDLRLCKDEPTLKVLDNGIVRDITVDLELAHKRDIYKELVIENEGKYTHYVYGKEYYTLDGKLVTPQDVFSVEDADSIVNSLTVLPEDYVAIFTQSSKSRK